MNDSLFLAIMIAASASLVVLGNTDERDRDQQLYCAMVELWNDNKQLPEQDRPGWPPYRGEC